MATSSVGTASQQTLLNQLLCALESMDRMSVESETLGDGQRERPVLERASAARSSSQSQDFTLPQNTKNLTSTSVPLSPGQHKFLEGRPSAQMAVREKLKVKGLDCEFDFDRGEMLAEADSSIDSAKVSKELRKIIIEHNLDVPPDHMDMLAAGVDTDVLTSWKTSSFNEAVIVKDNGTLKLVGLADHVDCLGKELTKTQDRLDARATGIKKRKGTGKRSHIDVLPLSESCYEYLSRYRNDAVFGYGSKDVKIKFTPALENCPQGIEISGSGKEVKRAKERLREIVKQVKTTRFVLPGDSASASDETIAYGIASKHKCIIRIGQSLACDTFSGEIVRLHKNGVGTSVFVVINELQLQKADVIVNTTHKNLTLGVGRVSTALLKECGPDVQEELRQKYPDGIEHGDVAITRPGGLNCSDIYHGALPFWKGIESVSLVKCFEALMLLVYRCLFNASASGYTSIAFPALGTGALEYPYEEVALLMYRGVRLFLAQNPDSTLEEIYFVVYPWASRELKQAFYGNGITQKVQAVQIEASDVNEAAARGSENLEVIFRVGKTLMKVLNADIKDACHVTSPVMVLWRQEDMQDPQRNKVLASFCPQEVVKPTFLLKVRELKERKTVLDETSVSTRTFIHCCCPSDKDKDVMTAVQQGLQRANKDKLDTVTLSIPPEGVLADNPRTAADIVLKTVKKCSSCVFVVTVVIPDSHFFTGFVTAAAKLYKSEPPPQANTTDLVETTWNNSYSQISQAQVTAALRMLPVQDNIMLTVTSDSDEKNNRVALEIQKAIQE